MIPAADPEILKAFPAAAEYLTNIHLIKRDYGVVANNRLAEWMGVSHSAVTQALGRLKKLDLVTQERYGHIEMTEAGRSLALIVLKRHYLLEHLLVKVIGYPWDKADEEAKVLQNQISNELAEHLDERLGHPQTCPHGNPLPGVPIEAKLLQAPRLHQAPTSARVLILRITEEGEGVPSMLTFCQLNGIKPGARFIVRSVDSIGLLLETEDLSQKFSIPIGLAKHLCYEV